jgi:hypothetical protein
LEDVRLIGGLTFGVLAGVGLAILVVRALHQRKVQLLLIVGATMSCFVFYIVSLYLGQASLILPRFAPPDSMFQMSNIRYGVQALLPIGLLVACLAAVRPRVLTPVLLTMLVVQGALSISTGTVMAFEDGTQGLSSQKISKGPDSPPVEQWLRAHYDGGLVLMDDYRRPIGPVESGVPMNRFIGTGNKPYWQKAWTTQASTPTGSCCSRATPMPSGEPSHPKAAPSLRIISWKCTDRAQSMSTSAGRRTWMTS